MNVVMIAMMMMSAQVEGDCKSLTGGHEKADEAHQNVEALRIEAGDCRRTASDHRRPSKYSENKLHHANKKGKKWKFSMKISNPSHMHDMNSSETWKNGFDETRRG